MRTPVTHQTMWKTTTKRVGTMRSSEPTAQRRRNTIIPGIAQSVIPAESLHFPHCCCNKLERGGKKALRWMERVISEREGLHHKRLYNMTST